MQIGIDARPSTPAVSLRKPRIRIVLVEDHAILREGLKALIEIESEMTLREELLMQLRSQSLQLARVVGLVPPRSELDRALDPVLEQARSIAKLNDPRGLYAYCWCREPRGSVKGLLFR